VIELKQYEKKVEELKQELKNMNVKTHSWFNVDNLSNFS
jgi:fatty acid-binding protein DegV